MGVGLFPSSNSLSIGIIAVASGHIPALQNLVTSWVFPLPGGLDSFSPCCVISTRSLSGNNFSFGTICQPSHTGFFSFLYSFREAVFAFIVCLDFMMRLKRWRRHTGVHKGVVKNILFVLLKVTVNVTLVSLLTLFPLALLFLFALK